MQVWFRDAAKALLAEGVSIALTRESERRDCRTALCRWEDDLFAAYPIGHEIIDFAAARALIAQLFGACGRPSPRLELVAGFDDPRIGGFADVARHRIVIERGCLYRFLILHESAHLLVPEDRRHGAVFTYVLQALYRAFLGIPEAAVQHSLSRHGLSDFTALGGERILAAA